MSKMSEEYLEKEEHEWLLLEAYDAERKDDEEKEICIRRHILEDFCLSTKDFL